MPTVISITVILATVFGTEWLVDGWLGEERRFWFGLGGAGLLVLAGAMVKAGGIDALTRYLRTVLIGAGIGSVLNRLGLRLGWLRRALRVAGLETEPAERPQEAWRGPRIAGGLLRAGWAAALIGIGMIWTGVFGG